MLGRRNDDRRAFKITTPPLRPNRIRRSAPSSLRIGWSHKKITG
jgi:hypothetical protein